MRLDTYLFTNGLAKSRSYAHELIVSSLVTVDGKTVTKPSYDVTDEQVLVTGEIHPFVGRGGVKLDFALDVFHVDPSGLTALDVGASNGGFTDCLIRRGAAHVVALDSGHGQLAPELASDSRIENLEGFNAKDISPDTLGCFDLIVCDVSFISQTLIIANIASVLSDGGAFISLIKPQFECGRAALDKGGVVQDERHHLEAIRKVKASAIDVGLILTDVARSPVTGGDGNTEFLALFKRTGDIVADDKIKEVTLCQK